MAGPGTPPSMFLERGSFTNSPMNEFTTSYVVCILGSGSIYTGTTQLLKQFHQYMLLTRSNHVSLMPLCAINWCI